MKTNRFSLFFGLDKFPTNVNFATPTILQFNQKYFFNPTLRIELKLKHLTSMGGAVIRAVDSQRQDVAFHAIMDAMTGETVTERLDLSHYNLRVRFRFLFFFFLFHDIDLTKTNYFHTTPTNFYFDRQHPPY